MTYLSKTDPSTFQDYLKDASQYSGSAERVVIPASEAEVIEICKEANKRKVPLAVSGNRTGLVGGAIPSRGRIISLEKLLAVRGIKSLGSEAEFTLETGRSLADIHKEVESEGWLYAPDPTEWNAALGGTISTNASGARYYKYGSTRKYVQSIRMVLISGDVVSLKRGQYRANADGTFEIPTESGKSITGKLPTYTMPRVKHAAGYFIEKGMDMIDLLIGSEGTLGIVTQATLRLIKPPEKVLAGVAFFPTEEMSWEFSELLAPFRLKKDSGFEVRALEYFDKPSLDLLRAINKQIPKSAQSAVWYELETEKSVEELALQQWMDILGKAGALDESWFGQQKKEQTMFRKFRHDLPLGVNEEIARKGFRKVATDFAVPVKSLPKMIETYKRLAKESKIPYVIFGHIGDGHLHWNLMPESKTAFDQSWNIYRLAAEEAIRLGGTVSAEHGIGKVKVPFLEMLYGEKGLREMAELKLRFDPRGFLSRGNMFPEALLPAL